jgi:hypothetical protein
LFKFCVKKHGYKNCLGARAVLGEEDERQPNGKVKIYSRCSATGNYNPLLGRKRR